MSNDFSAQGLDSAPGTPPGGAAPTIVTRPGGAVRAGEVLTAEELAVADRVARRLHDSLRAVLGIAPADARHASGLARALSIDRTTCQRAVFVASRPYPGPSLLTRLPGIKGLQQIAESARQVFVDAPKEPLDALDASIVQFQSIITSLAGSQSRLIRRLDATTAALEAEQRTGAPASAGPRQRMFHAATELTGRNSDCWLAIYLYSPASDNEGIVDLVRANGLVGHRARPDAVPLVFHSFATKPAEVEADDPNLGVVKPLLFSSRRDTPAAMLPEFSSDPPPLVSTQQPHEFCVQSIDEQPGGQNPLDLMFATRTRIVHPATGRPPIEEAWALINFPCRRLLFDVYMHRDLARACLASLDVHLWRPDFAQHVGDRWQTRFAQQSPPLQLLPGGLRGSASDAWPRHSELTRFLFERAGFDPSEFVGFRCDVEYPIWRAGYAVSFDFSTAGDDEPE